MSWCPSLVSLQPSTNSVAVSTVKMSLEAHSAKKFAQDDTSKKLRLLKKDSKVVNKIPTTTNQRIHNSKYHTPNTMHKLLLNYAFPRKILLKTVTPRPFSLIQSEILITKSLYNVLSEKEKIPCKSLAFSTAQHIILKCFLMPGTPGVLTDGFYFQFSQAFRNVFLDFI